VTLRLLALLLALLLAPPALADDKRPVPDYDGRPPPATGAADVAAWVPRVVLYPAYLVWSYGIRWPIGKLVAYTEHARTPRAVFRYVFLGPVTPTPSIFPVVLYDFGFQPSVGVRLLWRNGFFRPGSKLSIKLATGGRDWLRLDYLQRHQVADAWRVVGEASYSTRPDHVFYGLGPDTPLSARARFRMDRLQARVGGEWKPDARLALRVSLALRRVEYGAGDFGGDPTIDEQVAAGAIAELPAAYRDGFSHVRSVGSLHFDSRAGGRGSGTGVLLDLVGEENLSLTTSGLRWRELRGHARFVLHLDDVAEKVMQLGVRAQLVDGEGGEVPFTELASIGGSIDLRGFPSGRLYDHSGVAAVFDYRWPLSAWLDAHLNLAAGNVFGARFAGLAPGRLRGSFGLGLALAGLSAERAVELWTALGTTPIDDDFDVEGYRVTLGYTYAY
jgi:hypothetical protein